MMVACVSVCVGRGRGEGEEGRGCCGVLCCAVRVDVVSVVWCVCSVCDV